MLKVCYLCDDIEVQKVDGFVEVDEIIFDCKICCIFIGWMFVDSFGFNVVEYLIYDVWLIGCKQKFDVFLLDLVFKVN